MCGRIANNRSPEELAEIAKSAEIKNKNKFSRSYNIPPSSNIATVYSCDNKTILEPLSWGTRTKENHYLINIRLESIEFISQFKDMIKQNNFCYFIIDGYFEWKSEGHNKSKQPYFIKHKTKDYLIIAGLYEIVNNEKKVVILTQNANSQLFSVHDRMPVFLEDSDVDLWLKDKLFFDTIKFLSEVKHKNKIMKEFDMYKVGNLVNNFRNIDKDVIERKENLLYDKNRNFTLNGFIKITKRDCSVGVTDKDRFFQLDSIDKKEIGILSSNKKNSKTKSVSVAKLDKVSEECKIDRHLNNKNYSGGFKVNKKEKLNNCDLNTKGNIVDLLKNMFK